MNPHRFVQRTVMVVLLLGLAARPISLAYGESPTTGPHQIEPEKKTDALDQVRSRSLRLGGTATASGAIAALYKQFLKTHPDAPGGIWYTAGGNEEGIRQLVKGDAEAALVRGSLTEDEEQRLAKAYPDPKRQPREIVLSKSVVVIVVHPNNPVRTLTVKELKDVFHGEVTNWADIGGGNSVIQPVGTPYPKLSWGIFLRHVLGGRSISTRKELPFNPKGYTDEELRAHEQNAASQPSKAGTFLSVPTDDEVVKEVAQKPNAIGYCLLSMDGKPLAGVRILPLQIDGQKAPVAPTPENILDDQYPLQETIRVLISPNASAIAIEFLEYACSQMSASTLRDSSLLPYSERAVLLGNRRLADMKAGKGTRVSMIGIESEKTAISDLVIGYVRAKEVVQPASASIDADTTAVGAFLGGSTGNRDLLLLGDKPSTRAMELHGEKWNSLGVDKDGKPDGTGPKEYVLAGRAVAVIVNPANKIESLTLGQVQAIFQGDVDDWAIIGGTELAAPVGPGGRPAVGVAVGGRAMIPINSFGLRAGGMDARSSVVASVFHKEGVPADKLKRVTIKKDTAEVVAAVSMDPQAIGFVDLTAIPASGQNVKVLAIKMGTGEKAKIVQPTAENIKNAMYPLSQRYFLYVHPKASDTAKDFAKFISTCGGSEASPYADTVKAVMETYQKHGLISLADEAITRAAKDALAEAAAKARAEEAAKAKGNRK